MGPLCRESHPFLFFVIVQAGQNPGPCTSVSTSTLLAAPTYNTSHTRSMWLSPPACPGLALPQQPALQLLGGIKSQAIKEASSPCSRPLPLESTFLSQARDKPFFFLSFLAGIAHGSVCPYLAIIQMDCGSPEGWVPRGALGHMTVSWQGLGGYVTLKVRGAMLIPVYKLGHRVG